MGEPEEIETKIPIIYHDYYEGIDFYFLDDFNKIESKCPKCLGEANLEYCQGCRSCYCDSREYPEFCEECKKPFHHYCDEFGDKCSKCNGFICTNKNCKYRFAVVIYKDIEKYYDF